MCWCKTASILPKKAQITEHSLPKMRYRPSKKAPVSSFQAKKAPQTSKNSRVGALAPTLVTLLKMSKLNFF